MSLFGGGCSNNGGWDIWIWIAIIVVLILLCSDGNVLGAGSNNNSCCNPCCDPCDNDPCAANNNCC